MTSGANIEKLIVRVPFRPHRQRKKPDCPVPVLKPPELLPPVLCKPELLRCHRN
ncbi:hypothetical protein BZL30_3592 [Mycobacterium kansasii]|uniref:Uncharacterized protein n=1 Tax=Mycobacterium kansasii TaxID=1768 RepID=A0A1V3XB69_MYCKA|nr:hypothetical protein BZL30_3592 [Mycobacterium kansasii]